MGTMTEFALLVLGLAGLWFGTEITIRGAVTLANRLGISEFIIGVAVLSIGSDLPELAISIDGALKSLAGGDASDVVIGTALGSYLGQLGFVLGFVALFQRLTLSHGTILRHGAALVGSLVLLALTGLDGVITRFEGVMLVSAYVVYFAALFVGPGTFTKEESEQPPTGLGVAWILLVVGLVIVVVGAELTVSNAIRLAVSMNVSEAFVSIVLITAIAGRAWCGWACPQTVYMEFLFRPIDRAKQIFHVNRLRTRPTTPRATCDCGYQHNTKKHAEHQKCQ